MEPNSRKNNKRTRDDDSGDSMETKRIRDDLFLDEEEQLLLLPCSVHQDLASFMKTFEDELISLPADEDEDLKATTPTSQQYEQAQLGYLLEASDDELGLPPPTDLVPTSVSPCVDVVEDDNDDGKALLLGGGDDGCGLAVGLDGIWGFEDEISMNLGDGLVNLDPGLVFDYYSDVLCGLSDFSDLSWRYESLPAL